jgi:DNA-binding MarR family transcriptional regulator
MARKASVVPFHEMPGHLIRRAQQRAVAAFSMHLVDFDVTPLQYALLAALAMSPEDVDQVTLAQRAAIDTSTAASIVDRMEGKGWVERRLDLHDRRRRVLHLTPSGAALLTSTGASIMLAQEEILSPLTAAEQTQLLKLLVKLANAPGG